MALASAKQLLDELMGRDRNLDPDDKKNCYGYEDPSICKYFLVNFCPNELFVNTKADLGPCSKVHDEKVKSEYEKSPKLGKLGYEEDFLRFCQGMLGDVEKRIRRAKQRLALGNQENNNSNSAPVNGPKTNEEEKMQVISERINELLEKVEQLGCEGKVEEAQGIMKLCDQLKEEREAIKRATEPQHWLQQTAEIAAAQEKQMEVCEVCGAFLIVGDAQQRVDDHLMGKQHVGYARLKAAVEDILVKREKEKEEREKIRSKERFDRQKDDDDEKRRSSPRETSNQYHSNKSYTTKSSNRDKSGRHRSRSPRDREKSRNRSSSREKRVDRRESRSSRDNRREERHGNKRSHDSDRSKKEEKTRRRSRSRSKSRSSKHSDHTSSKDDRDKKHRRARSSDEEDYRDEGKKKRSPARDSRYRSRSKSRGHEGTRNGKDDD